MPPDADSDLPARLRLIEQALLDRVPEAKRAAVLRRILAALSPPDASALLADLARHPEAASWLQGLRDVA